MDGSTDRCPQCGAAIRPSARYCVTCGVKLPDAVASAYPAAASGWAAREEHSHTADPNPGSTAAWAMPASHLDDVDAAESELIVASTASADDDLLETVEEASPPISEHTWDASTPDPEPDEPMVETPIMRNDQPESEAV